MSVEVRVGSGGSDGAAQWLDFIARMTEAVIWPLAVLLISLAFRRQVREALARLKYLTLPWLEASFERGLETAENIAAADLPAAPRAPSPPEAPEAPAGGEHTEQMMPADDEPQPAWMPVTPPAELVSPRARQLMTIGGVTPSHAVGNVWSAFTASLKSLAMRHTRPTHGSAADIASRMTQLLRPSTRQLISELEGVASAARSGLDITEAQALRFRSTAAIAMQIVLNDLKATKAEEG